MKSRQVLGFVVVCVVAASAAGCDTIRSAAGQGKESPDEFAVVTKAPLVIPPDFNLHPPAAGAAPTNQVVPTQAAQAALFNSDPAAVAASLPATMSQGERFLLANAGVQNADPAIRQEIATDSGNARAGDESFTNNILFGSATSQAGTPVDADAEARRIDAQRADGSTPPKPANTPAAPPAEGDHGGWFGNLFNW